MSIQYTTILKRVKVALVYINCVHPLYNRFKEAHINCVHPIYSHFKEGEGRPGTHGHTRTRKRSNDARRRSSASMSGALN